MRCERCAETSAPSIRLVQRSPSASLLRLHAKHSPSFCWTTLSSRWAACRQYWDAHRQTLHHPPLSLWRRFRCLRECADFRCHRQSRILSLCHLWQDRFRWAVRLLVVASVWWPEIDWALNSVCLLTTLLQSTHQFNFLASAFQSVDSNRVCYIDHGDIIYWHDDVVNVDAAISIGGSAGNNFRDINWGIRASMRRVGSTGNWKAEPAGSSWQRNFFLHPLVVSIDLKQTKQAIRRRLKVYEPFKQLTFPSVDAWTI